MFPHVLFPRALFPNALFPGAGAAPIRYDALEALQAYFLGRADLRAATSDGRLWEDEAPEKTRYPFAEVFLVSEADDAVTTGPYKVVRTTLQLGFHDRTSQRAADLARRFEAALFLAPLAIQGLRVMHCLPGPKSSGKGEGKGPQGQDSFMCAFELEILWNQPVPTLFRS